MIGPKTKKPEAQFEDDVRIRLSQLWQIQFTKQKIILPGIDPNRPQEYDVVSPDLQYIGEVKWFKHSNNPGAKIPETLAKIWLLQIVQRALKPEKVFLVTNEAGKAAIEKEVKSRYGQLIVPVELYYFDSQFTNAHPF